jgi:hypothetical protein
MNPPERTIKCYICGLVNREIDSFLDSNGFAHGVLSFSIPDFGILFRCRTEGSSIDLEFAAFFALLEFIRGKLATEKIPSIQVFSSNPQFVFSFTGESVHLKPGTARRKLLDEHAARLKIAVGYVKPIENQALISSADFPSIPEGRRIEIANEPSEFKRAEFKPFQKGMKL